jgi:hypothetical protein
MNLFKRVALANAVVAEHNAGKVRAVIASEYGISENQVQYLLKHAREAGIFVRPVKRGRKSSAQTTMRRAEIANRYRSGESGPSIARSLGVTVETVYTSLRTVGVERRKRANTERNNSIVVRYQSGESGVKIAKDLAVTPKVVYDTLHRAGVVIRKKEVLTNA